MDSSLCDCVGRLRVFKQLEDLLKSLLIWLPLHPAKHTDKTHKLIYMSQSCKSPPVHSDFTQIREIGTQVAFGSDSMNTNTISRSQMYFNASSPKGHVHKDSVYAHSTFTEGAHGSKWTEARL